MTEIEKIKASVDQCNKRDIIRSELDEYERMLGTKYMTVPEFISHYYDTNAPKGGLFGGSLILTFAFYAFLVLTILPIFSLEQEDILPPVLLVIVVFAMIVFYMVLKKLYLKTKTAIFREYEQTLAEVESAKPELLNLCSKTRTSLEEQETLMRDENYCIIPQKYWDNANFLYALIQDKRAIDLVSAINKYEDIMHQMRMESMAQESLLYQEYAAECAEISAQNSEIAAENSRRAAVNSGIAAFFSIANYLSDD